MYTSCVGLPGRSLVKNQPVNAGDVDSVPGLGRSPGEGNGEGQGSLVCCNSQGHKESDMAG